MDNEITINGEAYIKKTEYDKMFHSMAHPVLVEDKPWPQEGEEFWYVDIYGDALTEEYEEISDKVLLERGNFFQTKEEAQMYALRIESLSKGFMHDIHTVEYWVWSFYLKKPNKFSMVNPFDYNKFQKYDHLIEPKFPTKEECQEWYDRFGKGWEFLLNKK